jgi:hypothetical protein
MYRKGSETEKYERDEEFYLWDITPCSPKPMFRRNMSIHLQGRIIIQAGNQHEAGNKQTFHGLRGVISQKTELFITTAVRTSNPIYTGGGGGGFR